MNRGLLRVSTAGSVDDGKSTLLGRLLFDAKSILEDQLTSLAATTARRGGWAAIRTQNSRMIWPF